MLRLTYLYRNVARNPLRTLLTCAAVALPIIIYVLSTSVVDGLQRFLDNAARQLRLVVVNKVSLVNPLPGAYGSKLRSLDPEGREIIAVCGMSFIGGRVENDPTPLSTLACDEDSFLATMTETNLTPDERAAWERDRQAIIVGSGIAEKFGWHKGDRITIRPSLPPYNPMEFHVVAISRSAADPITNFCRRDYHLEELEQWGIPQDQVSFYFVKCATKEALEKYRVRIDELFARTPDETRTQDEKAFMNEFITQQFNLPRNLTILGGVTVFVAIMAAANTMSMNFRDRLRELATLKALGFSGRMVFGVLQAESLLVCLLAGIVGATIPYVAFTHTPLREWTVPVIQHLVVDPVVCVHAMVISLIIGLLAAIWPSWLAYRLKAIVALRTVE